jgi:hypothetical protein
MLVLLAFDGIIARVVRDYPNRSILNWYILYPSFLLLSPPFLPSTLSPTHCTTHSITLYCTTTREEMSANFSLGELEKKAATGAGAAGAGEAALKRRRPSEQAAAAPDL